MFAIIITVKYKGTTFIEIRLYQRKSHLHHIVSIEEEEEEEVVIKKR